MPKLEKEDQGAGGHADAADREVSFGGIEADVLVCSPPWPALRPRRRVGGRPGEQGPSCAAAAAAAAGPSVRGRLCELCNLCYVTNISNWDGGLLVKSLDRMKANASRRLVLRAGELQQDVDEALQHHANRAPLLLLRDPHHLVVYVMDMYLKERERERIHFQR